MEWIPVTERLPEEKQKVLLYPTWQEVKYSVGYWMIHSTGIKQWYVGGTMGGNIEKGITHWSPLPPPPENDDAD